MTVRPRSGELFDFQSKPLLGKFKTVVLLEGVCGVRWALGLVPYSNACGHTQSMGFKECVDCIPNKKLERKLIKSTDLSIEGRIVCIRANIELRINK